MSLDRQTPALSMLDAANVKYQRHIFEYEEKGGTRNSSERLGVSEHIVIKTLVFKTEKDEPLIVLMHGDKQVATKGLAAQLGVKKISSCKPELAEELTGYQVGGISPFGTRKKIKVFAERSILSLPEIYINGGGRGFLVSLSPKDLVRLLEPTPIDVAVDHKER